MMNKELECNIVNGEIQYKITDKNGILYKNLQGKLHRVDGPAKIHAKDATEFWYFNGDIHREGGPAFTTKSCEGEITHKVWYHSGRIHREGGPGEGGPAYTREFKGCIIRTSWYLYGEPHRTDGPAIEYLGEGIELYNEPNKWYLYGEELTEEEYKKIKRN